MTKKTSVGNLVSWGLLNVWNKYLCNNDESWDAMYARDYKEKLESAEQRARHYLIAGLVADRMKVGCQVLDVGCGVGTTYRFLKPLHVDYHGMDLSAEAIAQGRTTFGGDSRVKFGVGDFLQTEFDTQYDVVFLTEVLYYFPLSQTEAVVRKAVSLLRNSESLLILSMSENPKASQIWPRLSFLPDPIQSLFIRARNGSKWTLRAYPGHTI